MLDNKDDWFREFIELCVGLISGSRALFSIKLQQLDIEKYPEIYFELFNRFNVIGLSVAKVIHK